ncbi:MULTISPECIES: SAM-dependent methyltransferase [Selenomonas]|uniref:Tetrapyrrole methylase n=1 Tax=Selenomonas ruminis TaxID=2593411 RepID=A0A5D6W6G3_9FIRM|nr:MULTISPECIES: SAM-dependent methyltransferase [unclassified Selenomonas]MBQ1867310.1 tetrapyrrole methylase [Selenomonas sp.]TYZ23456.1 tetrapyrrole methylase [Selenomonas sp. mPRGC5]
MATITVVGLGPGRAGLITRESWELMEKAERLVLRTRIHPTVEALETAGMVFSTYDGFYDEAADFETLYRKIAADLLARAAAEGDIVYAVPGSPLVAERTVVLLRELGRESAVTVDIRPGMSFVEVMYTRLGIDPIDGLTIIDAEDVETLKEKPAQSLVITQVYNQQIASDTKLMLMDLYPDEYEVMYIHNLALPDESIRQIPLYELDRQKDVDHLTSLFIRAKA